MGCGKSNVGSTVRTWRNALNWRDAINIFAIIIIVLILFYIGYMFANNGQQIDSFMMIIDFLILIYIVLVLIESCYVRRWRRQNGCERHRCSKRNKKNSSDFHQGRDDTCCEIAEQCNFEDCHRPFRKCHHCDHSVDMTSYSTNWCGYIAAKSLSAPVTGSCTYVSGSFRVPTIYTDVNNANNNVSIWTGIDGAFTSNQTVQQIGIDGANVNGRIVWYAWFEMYPQRAYKITGFPIRTGDLITCSCKLIAIGTYQLTMKNETQKKQVTIPTSYTRNPGAKLQSLEWVVEAPWMGKTLPLTHFSPITFSNCVATISGVTGPINKFANDDLNMVVAGTSGPNTLYKAKASAPLVNNGSSFTVTWSHI